MRHRLIGLSIVCAAVGLGPAAGLTPQPALPSGEPLVGPAVVLLPQPLATDEKLGGGCWVRFYDHRNYRGMTLALVGPLDLPKMDVPGGLWRDWDSVVVGAKATVSTFDGENYRDKSAQLRPGQHIPDLGDRKHGWFDEIRSARVLCST